MLTEALVTHKCGGPFTYTTLQLDDQLRPSECLIRIKATGLCHTDINFSKEKTMPDMFPGIFGHEGAGIVERIGSSVTLVSKGDHVIVGSTSCGECKYCDRKETGYCDLWFKYNFGVGRLDGSKVYSDEQTGQRITGHFFGQSSFAKHIVVSQTALVPVDKSLPWEVLAPLGCGVMTGAGAMLNVVQPTGDMSVVVVGVGAVGMSAIMALNMLKQPPKRIIAVDIVASKLEMARRHGATHGVNSKVRPELMKVLMDITHGQGVDGAIDTTGRPQIVEELIHSSARRGKVVAVGVGGLDTKVPIGTFEAVLAGLQYLGCNQGNAYPQAFLPELLKASEEGKFGYKEMIKTYPAKDIAKAEKDMANGLAMKPVLMWD